MITAAIGLAVPSATEYMADKAVPQDNPLPENRVDNFLTEKVSAFFMKNSLKLLY